MPYNQRNAGRVSGQTLGEAFEGLRKILGMSIVDLLIYDLERQGITFNRDEYYTLEHVRQVFEMTFGEDCASLLVGKLRKELGA